MKLLQDFILLELRNGFPILRIDHGSGEAKLTLDGRDGNGVVRLNNLNDGSWHRIDIYRHGRVSVLLFYNRVGIVLVNIHDS